MGRWVPLSRLTSVANSAWRVGGSSNAGKFLDSMLDSIKAAPVRYAMTEGVMASSRHRVRLPQRRCFLVTKVLGSMLNSSQEPWNPASLVRSGAEFGWRSVRKVYQGSVPRENDCGQSCCVRRWISATTGHLRSSRCVQGCWNH